MARSLSDKADTESGIADAFRMPEAARMSVRTLARASLVVTEIRLDRDGFGETDPIPYMDAAMLAVQFRAIPFHEASTDGRPVPVYDVRPDDTLFYDMRRDPRARVMTKTRSLHFVLPRSLLDGIADAVESHRIDGLFPPTGAVVRDRQLARLARAVLPVLSRPSEASALFSSHFTLALGIYTCWRYGGMQAPEQAAGRLCRLQTRLAEEYISANLDGGIELSALAATCGLPVRRFVLAFRETFGMAPYQWLTFRRLDFGSSLLRRRGLSLDTVASLSGFADAEHFRRVLWQATGLTPRQVQLTAGPPAGLPRSNDA